MSTRDPFVVADIPIWPVEHPDLFVVADIDIWPVEQCYTVHWLEASHCAVLAYSFTAERTPWGRPHRWCYRGECVVIEAPGLVLPTTNQFDSIYALVP